MEVQSLDIYKTIMYVARTIVNLKSGHVLLISIMLPKLNMEMTLIYLDHRIFQVG